MIYQKFIPKFPLNNFVDSIMYIEGNNKGTGLPKIAMSMVFNLEDSFKLFTDKNFIQYKDYKKFWVAGLQTKPVNVESYGISKMLVIQFKTLGAFAFLNDPMHYYTDHFVALDNIFSGEAENTWEKLQNAKSLNEKFLIIENFLYRKLLTAKLPDKKLISTIEILLNNKINISINEICRNINISRKHLNYLTKEFAGISPKTLSSLSRLQNTLKTMSISARQNLTSVAYQSDYFDQSHFINDFRKFTGLTPSQYVKLVSDKHTMKIIPHFIPFE